MQDFKDSQQQKGFTPNTIRTNVNNVKALQNWCIKHNLKIEKVSYNELMEYIAEQQKKGLTINTVRMKVKSIQHYFEFLNIKNNAALLVRLKGATRKIPHNLFTVEELEDLYETQHTMGLIGKRDKVVLSLIIFQACGANELEKLEVSDIDLQNGKIYIPASRVANSRVLNIHPVQFLLLQDYIFNIREEILRKNKRKTNKLLMSAGISTHGSMKSALTRLFEQLKFKTPNLKGVGQIRQSVIANWVDQHGLRHAQYMSGHRFVSSTERYNQDKHEGLIKEVAKHHPI